MAPDHPLESVRDAIVIALEAADFAGEMIVAAHLQTALDALDSRMMRRPAEGEKVGQQG